VITHTPSQRKLRFGQVAQAASKLEPPKDVEAEGSQGVEPHWQTRATPGHPRQGQGKPLFGIDVQLPGMAYAAIAQCPVFRGKLATVADERIKGLRGLIKVVKLEDAVAVVADNWWRAKPHAQAPGDRMGRGHERRGVDREHPRVRALRLEDSSVPVARNDGDVEAAFSSAAKVIEAEYYAAFSEPRSAGADELHRAGERRPRRSVGARTQNAEATHAAAARGRGRSARERRGPSDALGGGFGRRGFQD